MADELIDVSAEWAKRAYVDDAKYKAMYEASIKDPAKFWGEHGKRVDWIKPYSDGAVRDVDYTGDVRIRWFHDGVLNVSANCVDRHLAKRADQTAIIWEGDDPAKSKHITYRELHAEVCRMANALKELGVKKGDRVTIYLPMIPEAAYAMLACTRIGADPLGGVRRLLARQPRQPHRRLRQQHRHHRRRGPARRQAGAAQGQHRRGAQEGAGREEGAGRAPHRRQGRLGCRPRRLVARDRGQGAGRVQARADGRGGSAVHPLHLGLDREAQGRAAHDRRLHRLRLDDAPVRLRLSRRRHLLVHRRRGLGDRPQLHRLRAARQRRHDPDVRGRAQLSRLQPLLAGDRQAQGQHLLHRADRHPRPDARGRGAGEEGDAQEPAPAGLGRRADQSRGLALVLPRRRRRPLPDRRHLVADRDRRHPDHAAARRHHAQARLGDEAVLRRAARHGRCRGQGAGGRRSPAISA